MSGFEKGRDELGYVDRCPDCSATLVAMTPDELREHIVTDHDSPLGGLLVWPSDEYREGDYEQ